jgi:signal transduction histidine kinase
VTSPGVPALDVADDECFERVRPQLARDAPTVLAQARAALHEAECSGLQAQAVRALLVCGMAHDALGHAERDAAVGQALVWAEALADPLLLLRATNNQIVVDIYHGRYADALTRGQMLLGVAHVLQRDDLLGRLLHNLGSALSLIGEFELAIAMHEERLRLLVGDDAELRTQRARTTNNMAMAWLGLARSHSPAAAPDIRHNALLRARTNAEAACAQMLERENVSVRMGVLDTLVDVLLECGDVDAAQVWVKRVETASREALLPGSDTWGSFAFAWSRVALARSSGDTERLLQRLREIEALPGTRFQTGEMHAMLSLAMANALARVGAYEGALAYHRRWLQFEAKTQSLLAREHAIAVRNTLDSLRGETDEFITHDLRNPLGAAMVQMESVRAEPRDASESDALALARASVQRVLDTADHYLTVVRTRHLRRADLKAIDLAELVDDVGERLAPPAGARVRLERRIDWGLTVLGDRISLLMALTHLLRNALRHADAGTVVGWSLQAEADAAVLTVVNLGPPLSATLRSLLLSNTSVGEVHRGRGLGLTMIARVAQLHDARVALQDEGVCVSLRFPRVHAAV